MMLSLMFKFFAALQLANDLLRIVHLHNLQVHHIKTVLTFSYQGN